MKRGDLLLLLLAAALLAAALFTALVGGGTSRHGTGALPHRTAENKINT